MEGKDGDPGGGEKQRHGQIRKEAKTKGGSTVRVVVRVRPQLPRESQQQMTCDYLGLNEEKKSVVLADQQKQREREPLAPQQPPVGWRARYGRRCAGKQRCAAREATEIERDGCGACARHRFCLPS